MTKKEVVKTLAELLGGPVYIVGGYVRDMLLGAEAGDVDIASAFLPEEVAAAVDDRFSVCTVNKRLGTLKITCHVDGSYYEHTTFRVDSYPQSGRHSPLETRFTSSIEEDSLRRDFTVNAVYYDVVSDSYVDPRGGIRDILSKTIRTADRPEKVFGEDGLRLMRLARFVAELGFDVDGETLDAATNNVRLLEDISADRIWGEFQKLLCADTKHPSFKLKNAVGKGLETLRKIGALEVLFPGFRADETFMKVQRHIDELPVYARFAAMFLGQDEKSVSKWLSTSRCPKEVLRCANSLLRAANKKIRTKRQAAEVVVENGKLVPEICAFKRLLNDENAADLLANVYGFVIDNNLPFCAKELLIDGNDLVNIGICQTKRSAALKELLVRSALGLVEPTREKQLETLRRIADD